MPLSGLDNLISFPFSINKYLIAEKTYEIFKSLPATQSFAAGGKLLKRFCGIL